MNVKQRDATKDSALVGIDPILFACSPAGLFQPASGAEIGRADATKREAKILIIATKI